MTDFKELREALDAGPTDGPCGACASIDTADHVKHVPSGETWVVAYVDGDRLAWCGWPEGEAALADCALVKKATPEEREKLLWELADLVNDKRGRYAKRRIDAAMKEQQP